MPISMSHDAHYVTQQSVWSICYTGPLTSRRINHYKKRGYYAPSGFLFQSKEKTRKKLSKKVKTSVSSLLANLGL